MSIHTKITNFFLILFFFIQTLKSFFKKRFWTKKKRNRFRFEFFFRWYLKKKTFRLFEKKKKKLRCCCFHFFKFRFSICLLKLTFDRSKKLNNSKFEKTIFRHSKSKWKKNNFFSKRNKNAENCKSVKIS